MRDRVVIVDILTKKFKSVFYKQYDDNNELNIVVYEGKTLADISNYVASVYFELPSGKVYEVDGTIENNTIKVILSSSILKEYGQVNVECELFNLDEVVTTFTFYLNVEKSIKRVDASNPDVQPPQQTYHTHSNLDVLNQITQEMIDSIDSSEELIDLSIYQTKRDTALETDEKTVTGAINELNEKIENISVNVDLSDYALKSEIPIVPTNVSELNNDMGYLTEVPSEYITETELDNKGFATESFVTNKISETQLSDEQAQQLNDAYAHSQTPHVQQSDIPTKTSQLTNDSDFATNASVDEKIANVSTGGSVDLTSYAKKTDLPTKTSQLTNDSGFITEHQDISGKADRSEIPTKTSQLQNDSNFISSIPEEYITETELNSKGYLTEHQDISGKANKSDIPTKTSQLTNDSNFISSIPSEYVTETELNSKGYLTEHQDLSNYALKTEIPTVPTNVSQLTNDAGYVADTVVDNKIANVFTNEITEVNVLSIVLGDYQIKYNRTDNTLDFLFNGVIDEPIVDENIVPVTWNYNTRITSTGVIEAQEGAMLSDLIEIDSNYNYTIYYTSNIVEIRAVYYDSNQTFTARGGYFDSGAADTFITFPSNTAYFRIKAEQAAGVTVTDANVDIIIKKVAKTEEPGTPEEPVVNNYVSEGLSMHIDANDVTTYGSIRDITGNYTITNNGVSTTLDNGCLNFVSSESDYLDCGFIPNLTQWSAELYFYFTATPSAAETVLAWGASGSRTIVAHWSGGDLIISINDSTANRISFAPTSLTHLVLTYNNGTIIAYINGVKSEITASANVMASQGSNLLIGSSYSIKSFANIHLKSFRFYDGKVLNDKEVLQNYNYEINRE